MVLSRIKCQFFFQNDSTVQFYRLIVSIMKNGSFSISCESFHQLSTLLSDYSLTTVQRLQLIVCVSIRNIQRTTLELSPPTYDHEDRHRRQRLCLSQNYPIGLYSIMILKSKPKVCFFLILWIHMMYIPYVELYWYDTYRDSTWYCSAGRIWLVTFELKLRVVLCRALVWIL